jgi:hypothetical protein
MRRWSKLLLVITLVASVLGPPKAAAAITPERCVATLDDAEVTGRLQWMERLFHRAQRRALGWFWGWFSVHATIAIGGTVLAITDQDELHRDAFAWAASGSAAALILMTTPPISSAFLMRRFRRMPDATLAQRREKLDRAVALLARAARQEDRGRSWYYHALAMTFSATESFFLGVRHRGRPTASILNGLGTMVLFETQILTTPRGAFRAAIDFEYGSRPCMARQMRDDPHPSVELVPAPYGLGVGVRW